jgi:hypothetical protein
MRSMVRRIVSARAWAVLVLGAGLCACRDGSSSSTAPSASAAPSDASAAQPSAPSVPMPQIRLHGDQVLLENKFAGTTRVVTEVGRLQKIDKLYDDLKGVRESFKQAHPSESFPGRAMISAEPETPALAFKSAFQSAVFAGYPHMMVETAGGFVVVDGLVPDPPDAPTRKNLADLTVSLEDGKVTIAEKRDLTVVSETTIDPGAWDAPFQTRLAEQVTELVLRREVRSNALFAIQVRCANALPFARLGTVLRALRSAHERLAGPGLEANAFSVVFAVN